MSQVIVSVSSSTLFLSFILTIILSMCFHETQCSDDGSRTGSHHHQHHHHFNSLTSSSGGLGNNEDSTAAVVKLQLHHQNRNKGEDEELRRIPGKYICMEDERNHTKTKTKKHWICNCPTMYTPVCGSDGVTYHNRCFLVCASKNKYQGFTKLEVEKWGPCDSEHEVSIQG